MRKKKIIAVFLTAVLTASFALNCYAETTQEQIDSKKAEQKETQADYQNAQKTLKDLQGKKNDKEAFCKLITYIKKDLYLIAKTKLKNEDDIADVIQDTIIVCYKNIKNFTVHCCIAGNLECC